MPQRLTIHEAAANRCPPDGFGHPAVTAEMILQSARSNSAPLPPQYFGNAGDVIATFARTPQGRQRDVDFFRPRRVIHPSACSVDTRPEAGDRTTPGHRQVRTGLSPKVILGSLPCVQQENRIQILVLGPVEVVARDQAVRLSRLQRHVIAGLTVDCGRVLSVERLADSLWGEQQPSNARNRVQALVSSLRRQLGDGVIITHPTGYSINVDAIFVDAVQFEEELDRGRTTNDLGVLNSGLARWRGPAFDSISDTHVDAAARRFDELRIQAVEALIEIRLANGCHVDVIPDLAGTLATHPFRERLRGQLMTALYRCGRTNDALETYRQGYELVATELGVDPGPELQALHRAMLAGDPSLLTPKTASSSPAVNQLPPATPTFVGREPELALIASALTMDRPAAGPAIVAIAGMGGLGKTSLAVRAARQSIDEFPSGCLFFDLRGADANPVEPHIVLGTFLRALGVPGPEVPHDSDERLGLYRSVTSAQRLLIVLDNAAGESQVRPLLPGGGGCAVIITSRPVLSALDGCLHIDPPLFSDRESVSLIKVLVGPERLDGQRLALHDLARACSGMPLAVRIVAARLAAQRHLQPQQLATALGETRSRLHELRAGDLCVGASLQLSYERLAFENARLLPLLGRLWHSEFSAWTCSVLLDSAEIGAAAQLRLLVDAQLVTPIDSSRYGLHDLVQIFAANVSVDDDHWHSVEKRVADSYLATIEASCDLVSGGRHRYGLATRSISSRHSVQFDEVKQAFAWFDTECAALVGTVDRLHSSGRLQETWQLAYNLAAFFKPRHRPDEWLQTHQAGLASAQSLGDPTAEARIRESLGSAHREQRRYVEAQRETSAALVINIGHGDEYGAGRCHDLLGGILAMSREFAAAEDHHRQALATVAYATDPRNEANCRNSLGAIYGKLGRLEEAVHEFGFVLKVAEDAADLELRCRAHHNLARAQRLLGNHVLATEHAHRQVELVEATEHKWRVARAWEALGDCLSYLDVAAARDAWNRALVVFEEIGDPHAEIVRQDIATGRPILDDRR